MQDGAIKLHRVENVLIAGCEFLDFARDAIRFDGGVNGGEIIIGDNKFINETPGGVNGIYFRAYAREANSEESYITIFNNVFKNIGCGTDTEAYTGAISARNYQEGGVDIEIADNVFENCYNAMFIRNNAEVANHAAYPWKLTAEYNVFKGIPEGVYFRHKKGADKDETNPTLAKFQNNLFLDNDGNVITEPASEKLQGVKEIEDNLAKASDHEKGYFIGMEQPQAIVNNAWANIPAGTEIDFAGEVLKKGETAFGNIPEALAEVDGGYIYIMPGTYPESFAINKDNTVLVGLGGCPKALGEDDYYNVAVFLPDVTVTINANVKHTVLGLLGFSGSAMIDLQGGGQEDCLITDCIFDGCNKDGVIVVSGNMQGLRLENLSVINQTGARFFYGKANVVDFAITGCEFIGEQTFDWIRFGFAASAPRFVGGAVDIIGNYFGKSQESALFFLGHYSGAEFNIVDNVFLNQKNTSVDIRTTTDTELKLTSMNIIHNKFFRDEYVADIWGCIRLRFTGYTEDLLDVNINYNSISGWGDVDIVDNATSGAFTLQVINFDYNYFADVKEIDNTKNFGGIGKSWENLFESEEELNAMWSKQAEEGPHIW